METSASFEARYAPSSYPTHRPTRPSDAFLCGLKYEVYDAIKVSSLGEVACRAQQHGRVAVVAAGVHDPIVH
jgi:hypothetical protein